MEGAPAEVDAIQELMARIGNFVAEHPAAAEAPHPQGQLLPPKPADEAEALGQF